MVQQIQGQSQLFYRLFIFFEQLYLHAADYRGRSNILNILQPVNCSLMVLQLRFPRRFELDVSLRFLFPFTQVDFREQHHDSLFEAL